MRQRYYDWFDRRWITEPTFSGGRGMHGLRRNLLINCLCEINHGEHPIARLYALLLARTLCQADRELMEELGEEVAAKSDMERRVT